MRWFVTMALLLAGSSARADVRIGAAVGAGGRGQAVYSALDVRFDGAWNAVRVGLGARGVWLDGDFRDDDWDSAGDAIRAVRLVEIVGTIDSVELGAAAGGLSPSQLAHVADGYRATLDDRQRTGLRATAGTPGAAITAELDDVLDPHLAGGALEVTLSRALVGVAAVAADPAAGEAAIELAAARRWTRERARIDTGGGLVGEPGFGAAALAFATATFEHDNETRVVVRAELRGGTGSVGAAFGPLHRIEPIYDHARSGIGAAASAGIASRRGWVAVGWRARPELGHLVTASVGAPSGRRAQLGAWLAMTRDAAAGAAELRLAWRRRMATTIELARMYDPDSMPNAIWCASAWFAVASD